MELRLSLVSNIFCHIFAILIFTVQDYSITHFETLIVPLQQPLPSIITNPLSPCTPDSPLVIICTYPFNALSLFWSPSFGLGPAVLPFHITYLEYLCATNAVEHVLLAFVHWQDAPSNELSSSFGGHQQKGTLLAMPYRISTLQMPYCINSKYIQGD
jgi:hypothetical protein